MSDLVVGPRPKPIAFRWPDPRRIRRVFSVALLGTAVYPAGFYSLAVADCYSPSISAFVSTALDEMSSTQPPVKPPSKKAEAKTPFHLAFAKEALKLALRPGYLLALHFVPVSTQLRTLAPVDSEATSLKGQLEVDRFTVEIQGYNQYVAESWIASQLQVHVPDRMLGTFMRSDDCSCAYDGWAWVSNNNSVVQARLRGVQHGYLADFDLTRTPGTQRWNGYLDGQWGKILQVKATFGAPGAAFLSKPF